VFENLYICAIMGALIRKVFKKGGYQIGDYDQVLSARGVVLKDASPWRLIFTTIDLPNSVVTAQPDAAANPYYDLPVTGSIYSVASATGYKGMYDYFQSWFRNGADGVPYQLILQGLDTAGTNAWLTKSELFLQDETLHINAYSTLKIQNRSIGAASGANTTIVVDQQPLTGKLFTFRGGDPRLRWMQPAPATPFALDNTIAGIPVTGLEAVNMSGLYGEPGTVPKQGQWTTIPTKDKFENCISAKPFNIAPGETEQTHIEKRWSGKFVPLITKMRAARNDNARYHILPGRSQMLICEEMIRTPSGNPVVLGYERMITVGAWLTTSKKTISFGTAFTSAALAAVVP